jgi:branched-subunit amino acid transport protein AzlD
MKLVKKLMPVAMLALLVAPLAVSALTIETVGNTIGLGTADLKETVINIIQWVLGLLGLIAVIMILWGGFMWMTAGGNEDKVATAKKIITAAVIGLIVILLAWAIVTFVVGTASNVTE